MSWFVHVDLEMRFAPQRRALFRHLDVQKCSEREVFLAFLLTNVLCATTACFFDIATSRSGPKLRCFVHFDLETRFAPQRRALFFDIWTSKSAPNVRCF